MTETSYPSPNHNSRNVTDGEYERIGAYPGDGVHGDPGDGDVVLPGVGLQVLVKAGTVATVRGHVWEAGSTDVPLAVSANASSSTRYDWVTLRLDRATWDVTAHIVEGTPGSGYPGYTSDVGDTGTFDMGLALLSVAPGAAAPTITRATRYTPSKVSVANSAESPFGTKTGDMLFRPDTGSLELWDGGSYNTVYSDTGQLTLGAGFNTWVDYAPCVGQRKGGVVTLRIAKRRVGQTFASTDSDGSKLLTLPADFTPEAHHYFPVNVSGHSGGATLEIRPDGEVWIIENEKDIEVGRVIVLTATYIPF